MNPRKYFSKEAQVEANRGRCRERYRRIARQRRLALEGATPIRQPWTVAHQVIRSIPPPVPGLYAFTVLYGAHR